MPWDGRTQSVHIHLDFLHFHCAAQTYVSRGDVRKSLFLWEWVNTRLRERSLGGLPYDAQDPLPKPASVMVVHVVENTIGC